jgi:adenylate kinase family enzyme
VDEQRRRIAGICQQPEWILDTAYQSWLEIPLRSAELIVALDYPRWFSLQRLLRRTIARIADRRPICNGNRESLANLISRDSILVWHFRSFTHKRQRIRQWCRDGSGLAVVRFTSAAATERWITEFTEAAV